MKQKSSFMSSLIITSENQIQRLNAVLNEVKKIQELDLQILTTRPNRKTWNIIEIIEHLSIAYSMYQGKVADALAKSIDRDQEAASFKARPWQKFVINSQRPKGNKRRWKMKTLKKFEPVFDHQNLNREEVDTAFSRFFKLYGHMKASILTSRHKDVSSVKFSSAIGPIVNFYLPEGFEFVLCHAERHMVQIQEILDDMP